MSRALIFLSKALIFVAGNMKQGLIMKRIYALLLAAAILLTAGTLDSTAQTQKGVVKTKGRMVNGQLLPGTKLGGAVIAVRGRSSVLSQGNGSFSFPVSGQTFMLDSVRKKGYQLVDAEATPKSYAVSKNPLYVLMETPEQQMQDKLNAERKIRRTLQRQLQEREDEIEALKEQQKLSDAEYRQQLQQLYAQQESNENLISQMADRYSKMDFDEVDEFNRRISQLILDGKLTEADSLINTKGDINDRADALRQHQEANAQAEQEIAKKQKQLEKSKALARKELEDLAQDCYSKYEIFKIQYQNDSAAFYISLRAELDTTNVFWQLDAAKLYQVFLSDYAKALHFCERALRQSIIQEGDTALNVAICYSNIGLLYKGFSQYDKALEYYQKSLPLYIQHKGEQHEEIGDLYISIGVVYQAIGNYATAMEYGEKALQIIQNTDQPNRNYVSRSYTFLGNVYRETGDYEHAEEYHMKAMQHAEKAFEEYCEDRAIPYQNLGVVYKAQKKFDQAMELYDKALRIYLKIFGEKHEAVGNLYNNIGSCLMESGKNEEATPYLLKSLDILSQLYGEDNVQVAVAYANVGSNYGYAGDYEKAAECYWKALDILLPKLDSNHPYIGSIYMGLGEAYNRIGNYVESKKYILKCVEVYRKVYGEDYPYRKEIEKGLEELEPKLQQQLQQQQ